MSEECYFYDGQTGKCLIKAITDNNPRASNPPKNPTWSRQRYKDLLCTARTGNNGAIIQTQKECNGYRPTTPEAQRIKYPNQRR